MANSPKITKDGFVGNLIGIADYAKRRVSTQISPSTIADLQARLKAEYTGEVILQVSAVGAGLIANWNAGNTSYTIEDGVLWQFIPIAGYTKDSNGEYTAWLMTSYGSDNFYFTYLQGGTFQPLEKVVSQADLKEVKALVSSSSHTLYKAAEVTTYTSDDGGVTPKAIRNAFEGTGSLTASYAKVAVSASNVLWSNVGNKPSDLVQDADYATVKANAAAGKQASLDVAEIRADYINSDTLKSYVLKSAVTASTSALDWGKTSTVMSVDGKVATVTMPSKPVGEVEDFVVTYTITDSSTGAGTSSKSSAEIATAYQSGKRIVLDYMGAIIPVAVCFGDSSEMQITYCNYPPYVQVLSIVGNTATLLDSDVGFMLPSFEWLQETDQKVTTLESVAHTSYESKGSTAAVSLVLGKTVESSGASSYTITTPSTPSTSANKLREAVWRVKVGTTVPSITWPSGLLWANGEVPTLEASTYYEFNFSWCVDTWAVAYQAFKAV